MALTDDDLKAIQQVVQNTVQPMIDDLAQDTAAGFAEVHGKFAEVHDKFAEVHDKFAEVHGSIDQLDDKLTRKIDEVDAKIEVKLNKLENTVQRVDAIGIEVTNLKQKAGIA